METPQKFCTQCGAALTESMRFCPACGEKRYMLNEPATDAGAETAGSAPDVEMMVRAYPDSAAFERGSRRLAAFGWKVINTRERRPQAGWGRILTLGVSSLVSPPKPELVVTYQRTAPPEPDEAPFSDAPYLIVCAACGEENPGDTDWCQHCDRRLGLRSLVVCDACGYHNSPRRRSCESCGEQLPHRP